MNEPKPNKPNPKIEKEDLNTESELLEMREELRLIKEQLAHFLPILEALPPPSGESPSQVSPWADALRRYAAGEDE